MAWGLVRVDTQVIKRWEISNLLSRMTFGHLDAVQVDRQPEFSFPLAEILQSMNFKLHFNPVYHTLLTGMSRNGHTDLFSV